MYTLFFVNYAFALSSLLVPAVLYLCEKQKIPGYNRMAFLGFVIALSAVMYSLGHFRVIPISLLYRFVFAFVCFLGVVFYVSFMFELTARERPRHIWRVYALSLPVSIASGFVKSPWVLFTLVLVIVLLVISFSLLRLRDWIRSVTDERARRDGQWLFLIYSFFSLALVLCTFIDLKTLYPVLAIWYLIMFFAIRYLEIFDQLTNLENQLVLDNVTDLILLLDPEGRIIRINRRARQLLGDSGVLLKGRSIGKVIIHGELDEEKPKEWLDRYSSLDLHSRTGRSPSIDAFIITHDGDEIPVDLRIICMVDLSLKVNGYMVSATDMRITRQLIKEISDREYATRELSLSESKFSRMFIFNPTGILIVNLESLEITDANPAIEEILDCEASSLVGRTLHDIGIGMGEDSLQDFMGTIRKEGIVQEFSTTVSLKSGTKKKCRLSAVSFDLNRTGSILLAMTDITQYEQLCDVLARKKQVETVGSLAGGIAHDFNNILAVILGHVGLAKMRITDPHVRAPIEKAEQACLRAREITGQLLAFSRGGKPVIGVCDTRQVITESAQLPVQNSTVSCLFDIERDIWPLKADRIQIGQVITNLVGNAVAAMNRTGIIHVSARNRDYREVSVQRRPLGADQKPLQAGRYVEIRVKDHGPGIPNSLKQKIFEPFFTTKEKGTGLGLSIVYSIVENHGGAISVDSVLSEGAVFLVTLPAGAPGQVSDADLSAAENLEATVEDGACCEVPAEKTKVLLMDDDPLVRESASGLLASIGFSVTETADGQEAVVRYRDAFESGTPYRFCILDLVVERGMPGVVCAKQILLIDPSAVLVVSSGYSDDPVLAHPENYGISGIIPKPYSLEELKTVLEKLLVL
jgi:PAS domain S-box-containing protein